MYFSVLCSKSTITFIDGIRWILFVLFNFLCLSCCYLECKCSKEHFQFIDDISLLRMRIRLKLSLNIFLHTFFASRHHLGNYHWTIALNVVSTCEKYFVKNKSRSFLLVKIKYTYTSLDPFY